MSAVLFIVFIITMLLGMPVAFALLSGAIVAVWTMSDIPLFSVVRLITPLFVDANVLICIPLYVLAGNLMALGGLGERIVQFANVFVGRSRGGLGSVNIMASLFFGGISGSATAGVAAIGSVLIPAMAKEGYPKSFATAVTVVASPLSLIIPPSITMIVYSWIAGQSVAAMFAGGYLPGLLIAAAMMITCWFISVRKGYPISRRYTFNEAVKILLRNIPAVLMPFVIVGSIIFGIATPAEAAAVAVAYGFIISRYLYKELEWSHFPKILADTAKLTGCILILMAAAQAFAWVITFDRLPFKVAQALMDWGSTKNTFLFGYFVLLIILGMFMAPTEAMLIAVPILLPVAQSLGIHPVHFGITSTCALAMGHATPPVGMCIYLGSAISGAPVEQVIKDMLPFFAVVFLMLLLLFFVPEISLVLPRTFGFI
ncbi:MAG: C4-dicarboxylate TRAP transporter large permease protein DctM [Desulfovibrio sp.]